MIPKLSLKLVGINKTQNDQNIGTKNKISHYL